MKKIWSIVRYEYGRHIYRRAFLLAALAIPVLIAIVIGVIAVVVSRSTIEQRLGAVDLSGRAIAVSLNQLGLQGEIPIDLFPDEAAAREALNGGAIDAYIVIPDDYMQTGKVRGVGRRRLSDQAEEQIRTLLRYALLATVPEPNRGRMEEPAALVLSTLESGRQTAVSNPALFSLPYAFALLFIMTTFTTSGYLVQAIAEEKQDRVIEIMATTVSPRQMMAGKVIGLGAVGLTQTLAWIAVGALGMLVVTGDMSWLTGLQLPWRVLGLALLYYVLGYLLIAACYATIGAAVTTPQEAQPLVAPVSLLALAPLFLIIVILTRPNGLLAVIFSLIPFSAPMTMLMRLPLADIPTWQLVASLLMLLLSATGAVLLSARVMRLGMLRYGKRLSVREMIAARA